MNRIAYSATWANGVCPSAEKSALFEDASLESLKRLIRRVESVIVGYNAYRILLERKISFANTKVAVLSKENASMLGENISVATSAKEALGFFSVGTSANVLIAGGVSTVTSFMEQGLVDELILDIEPAMMPGATGMFPTLSRRLNMELIGMRKIGAATVQMHYKILP